MALRHLLLLIYLAVAVLSLTGLLFRDLSTADGLFLGLPAGLAWVTGWAALTPFVMWAYMSTEPEGSDAEGSDAEGSDAEGSNAEDPNATDSNATDGGERA